MALLRQTLASIAVLAVIAIVALWAFEAPGRFLLSHREVLPGPLIRVVEAVSRAGDKVGPTSVTAGDALSRTLVVTDAATPDRTRDRLRVIGTGQAVSTVAIHPDASGLITEVRFRSGDRVQQGQVLAVLQSDAETVAVERARIALEAAQDQVRRYRALLNSNSITSVQFDEVRRAAEAAALDLRAAEIALDDRRIVAPIGGIVGLVTIEPGSYVSSDTLVATVDDRAKLKVMISVPEAFVPEIAIGHAVTATPTTRTGRTYDGEITALDNRIDETSRTLRAEATVDNSSDILRPGMSFTVDIAFNGQDYLSVDALAIQWERAGPFVWTVDDGQARKARIEIIERNVDRVLVASQSLVAGQPVVIEGVQQLREGSPVRVNDPEALPDVPQAPEGTPTVDRDGSLERNRAGLAPAGRLADSRAATR
ncbi:efflux RND transporter periplasmic adaptor subunit [Aureimonas sp. OT7]|uniref:efflux RND transporter periplasmic adaptor subunit n=1 Tax=Aureimonas TaxID=414371 RepID=UPI0017838CE1|nr:MULTISPECIES: efflux RND transporter periplasmic adaptor subunit [Aureimonas]QOG08040.1 efflux RND transporter periplasmic adaptor subunit [Aureimonas sp. OT7]